MKYIGSCVQEECKLGQALEQLEIVRKPVKPE